MFLQMIMRQLSALKKQYRDDLEDLTRAYELRRKVLKDSLVTFNAAAAASTSSAPLG